MSMTKRFQGKAIDIARNFQDIWSNLKEGAEFHSMNSLMELYSTNINWKFWKMEMIQWKRVILLYNVAKYTTSLKYLHQYIAENSDHRVMWPNLVLFLKLYLLLSCTSCYSERGFGSLRLIKTYLRSTMGADKLNACALCNILMTFWTNLTSLQSLTNGLV